MLVLIGLVVFLLWSYTIELVMGGVLAVLLYKPFSFLVEKRKLSSITSISLITFGVLVLLMLPLSLIVFTGAKAGSQQLPTVLEFIERQASGDQLFENPIFDFAKKAAESASLDFSEIKRGAIELTKTAGSEIAKSLGNLAKFIPNMLTSFFFVLLGMILCLLKHKEILVLFRRHSPFKASDTQVIFRVFEDSVKALFLATLLTGLAQAILFALGCAIAGTGHILTFSMLVFIMSFIPVIGASPLTFSIAGFQLLMGNYAAGIILLVFAITLTLVDNIVRPLVLKSGADLHPLLTMISVFVGISTLGFSGIFLGPLLFIMTSEVYKILYEGET